MRWVSLFFLSLLLQDLRGDCGPKCPVQKRFVMSNKAYNQQGYVLIFVSFSLSQETLKSLWAQAHKIGGYLVFRGFSKEGFMDTQRKIGAIKGTTNTDPSVWIDPTLFDFYNITQVPSVVFTPTLKSSDPYDKMTGSMTLAYALDCFLEKGETGIYLHRYLQDRKDGRAIP